MSKDLSSTISVPAFDLNLTVPQDPQASFAEGGMNMPEGADQIAAAPEEAQTPSRESSFAEGGMGTPNYFTPLDPADYGKIPSFLQEQNKPVTAPQDDKTGSLEAGTFSALYNSPEAVAGMAGFRAGFAAPIPHPVGKVAAGLVLSVGAAALAHWGKELGVSQLPKGMSDALRNEEALTRKEHPIASMIGQSALLFKPSPTMVFKAAGAAKMLFSDAAGFTKFAATPDGRKSVEALVNVAVGGGIVGGSELIHQITSGDIKVGQFVAAVAVGGLFSSPNKLGKKILGEPLGKPPSITEIVDKVQSTPQDQLAKEMEQMLLPLHTNIEDYRLRNGLKAEEGAVPATSQTVKADHFSNPNSFYRVVVGRAALDDMLQSGVVRSVTPAATKSANGKVSLDGRPTAFPSFGKGKAGLSYAKGNDTHFVIETTDSSIQPSKLGRHGKGTTHFPTDASGNPINELPLRKVRVYEHVGDGEYRLVIDEGKPVDPSLTPRTDNLVQDTLPLSTDVPQPEFKLEGETGAAPKDPFGSDGQAKFDFFGELAPREPSPEGQPPQDVSAAGEAPAVLPTEDPNQGQLPFDTPPTYPSIKAESSVAEMVNSWAEVRANFNGTKGILSVQNDTLVLTPLGKKDATPIEVGPIGEQGTRRFNEYEGLKLMRQNKPKAPAVETAAPEAPAATEPPKKSKLEAWADETIAESRGRLNMGLDPVLLAAYGTKGAYFIARGARDFAAWSAQMVREFGESVKPHLDALWAKANEIHDNPEAGTKFYSEPSAPLSAKMDPKNPKTQLKFNDALTSYLKDDADELVAKVEEAGLLNIDKYGDDPESQKMVAAVADAFSKEFGKKPVSISEGARRVEAWFQKEGIADVMAKLRGKASESGVDPSTFQLAGMIVIKKLQNEADKAKLALQLNPSSLEAQEAFRKASLDLIHILAPVQLSGEKNLSEFARAMAFARHSGSKYLDHAILALNSDNPLEALKKMPLTLSQKALGAAGEMLVNSVLGWKSAIGNIIGGVGQSVIRPAEFFAGGIMNKDEKISSIGLKMYAWQIESIRDAAKAAFTSFKTLEPVLTGASKLDEARGGVLKNENQYGSAVDQYRSRGFITSETFGLDPKSNPVLAPLVDSLGEVFRFSQRLMIPTDEFFKTMNAYSMGKAKLHIEGHNQGLSGAELEAFVKQGMETLIDRNGRLYSPENIKQEIADEIVKEGLRGEEAQAEFMKRSKDRLDNNVGEIAKYVKDYVEEITFQQKQMSTSDGKNTVAKTLVESIGGHPALRLATGMYFVNTPINIFRWTAQRVPVGLLNLNGTVKNVTGFKGIERLHLQYTQDILSGDPFRMASARGKMATGASILFAGVAGALGGYMTGAGPSNKDEAKTLRGTGWLPYSFKIPKSTVGQWFNSLGGKADSEDGENYYIQFNRIDPVGTHLMFFAEYADLMRNAHLDHDSSGGEIVQASLYSGALALSKLFFEKSTLTNIKQALQLVDPENMKDFRSFSRAFDSYLQKRVSPAVVPAVISQILTAEDEELTEARGLRQAIVNRLGSGISGALGEAVNKQRNIFGEPNERATTGLTLVDAISPILVSPEKNDPVMKELASLHYGFTPPQRYHSPNGDKNVYDIQTFVLPNGQTGYDRLQELNLTTKLAGKTMRQAVADLIKTKGYQTLPRGDDTAAGATSARVDAINKIKEKYYAASFAQFRKENPEFDKLYTTSSIKNKLGKYLNTHDLDQKMKSNEVQKFLESMSQR